MAKHPQSPVKADFSSAESRPLPIARPYNRTLASFGAFRVVTPSPLHASTIELWVRSSCFPAPFERAKKASERKHFIGGVRRITDLTKLITRVQLARVGRIIGTAILP